MDWIVLENVKPYDGRYPLDLEGAPLTIREWGWIKRLSGYLPATAGDGYNAGDAELQLVVACIALRRAGRIQTADVDATFEQLVDRPAVAIRWEPDPGAEVADDDPDPTASSSGSSSSSGNGGNETSGSSDDPQKATGTPASDSSPSVPATLAS